MMTAWVLQAVETLKQRIDEKLNSWYTTPERDRRSGVSADFPLIKNQKADLVYATNTFVSGPVRATDVSAPCSPI